MSYVRYLVCGDWIVLREVHGTVSVDAGYGWDQHTPFMSVTLGGVELETVIDALKQASENTGYSLAVERTFGRDLRGRPVSTVHVHRPELTDEFALAQIKLHEGVQIALRPETWVYVDQMR